MPLRHPTGHGAVEVVVGAAVVVVGGRVVGGRVVGGRVVGGRVVAATVVEGTVVGASVVVGGSVVADAAADGASVSDPRTPSRVSQAISPAATSTSRTGNLESQRSMLRR
jgi:hypothetical protein